MVEGVMGGGIDRWSPSSVSKVLSQIMGVSANFGGGGLKHHEIPCFEPRELQGVSGEDDVISDFLFQTSFGQFWGRVM